MLAVQPEFSMCAAAIVFWINMQSRFLLVRVVRLHLGKGGKVNAGPSGIKDHLKEWNVETGCSKHKRDIKRNETSFWTSRKGERRQKC